jgi:hypothetical protein
VVAATQRYKSSELRVTLLTLYAGLAAIVVLQTYSQKQQEIQLGAAAAALARNGGGGS